MTEKNKSFRDSFINWLSKLSVVYLTAWLGIFLTIFITFIHACINYIFYGVIGIEDILKPLGYGAILTPFMVYIFSQIFTEIDKAKHQVENMQQNESKLKSSLAQTYVAMINQRDKNVSLSKVQEKLQGSLDEEISQKIEAQNRLEEQSAFFSEVTNLTPDIILYRDVDGNIKGTNQNLLNLLGVKTNEDLAIKLNRYQNIRKEFEKDDDKVKNNKEDIIYECQINNTILQMHKRPAINSKGVLIGIMSYGQDITRLRQEQDILEKASKDKSVFISTLSHELRTPLNGIVGLSDILLNSGHFNDEDMRSLKAINVSAVTLGNIFNDVIDLNKFERNTFLLSYESVCWQDFMSEIETLTRFMAEQKKLEFKYSNTGECHKYVSIDATRMRQILWNIISNAIKFTKEGSISIDVASHITNDDLANVVIKIRDTGIGMEKQELSKIFNLYYQVSGTKQPTGTGIGLHVVKKLCQAFGGSVFVDSEPNKGTVFTLTFNFKRAFKKDDTKSNIGLSLNVLLVEDIDLNIFVAKTMLEKQNHKVFVAKTGQEALKQYQDNKIDLVLLDMQLPDMNGMEVADHLYNEYNCRIPMVALTANVINEKEHYAEHHIIDVLNKPLSAVKLQEKIALHILPKN